MKIEFLGKFHNIARRALLITLCLCCIFVNYAAVYAAGQAYAGYKWTRIKSEKELNEFLINGETDKDRYKFIQDNGQAYANGKTDNDETHWFRFMLVWDDKYFMSESNTSNDGKNYEGKPILATYGVDLSQDSFVTRTGLGTPFMKFASKDGQNSNCNRVWMRFANSDGSGLGSNFIALNASWYGIVNHSLIYSQLRVTNVYSPTTERRAFACHATLIEEQNIQFVGDQVYVYYNVPGDTDRFWEHSGTTIETSKTQSGSSVKYKLYMASPAPVSLQTMDIKYEAPYTSTIVNTTIDTGVLLTIPKGATAVVSGHCYNNGRIVVDGGTLIINGILDSDSELAGSNPFVGSTWKYSPGSVEVKNGGTLLIEETGVLITRKPDSSGFNISGNSAMVVDGAFVYNSSVVVDASTVRVRPGAVFLMGFVAGDTADAKSFGRDYIRNHSSNYLDQFGNSNGSMLVIKNKGSFYCDGLLYSNNGSSALGCDSGSFFHGTIHSNYHSSISSMMTIW